MRKRLTMKKWMIKHSGDSMGDYGVQSLHSKNLRLILEVVQAYFWYGRCKCVMILAYDE